MESAATHHVLKGTVSRRPSVLELGMIRNVQSMSDVRGNARQGLHFGKSEVIKDCSTRLILFSHSECTTQNIYSFRQNHSQLTV